MRRKIMDLQNTKKCKGKIKFILLGILIIVIVGIGSSVLYVNSNTYKIKNEIKLGDKYLNELDYEQAIAAYQRALAIDSEDEAVIEAVNSGIEQMYSAAQEHGKNKEYAAEKEIATYILQLDNESVAGNLVNADAEWGSGNTDNAKKIYEKILEKEPENTEALQGKENCEILLSFEGYQVSPMPESKEEAECIHKFIVMCQNKEWDAILEYMDDAQFKSIISNYADEGEIICIGDINMVIGRKGEEVYVYCGDWQNGEMTGEGTGIIRGKETGSIYAGAWTNNLPNGQGVLTIKNNAEEEDRKQAYEGKFTNGVMDGTIKLTLVIDGQKITLDFDTKEGKVTSYKTGEDGSLWLEEKAGESGCILAAEYEEVINGIISDYLAGVPGFGGSDKVLELTLKDVEAPVISWTLSKDWMPALEDKNFRIQYSFKKGIKAMDNIDGDISSNVLVSTDIDLNDYSWWQNHRSGMVNLSPSVSAPGYTGEVIYRITDSSGNIASYKAVYEFYEACGVGVRLKSLEKM